jgi:hypothetical protein
MAEKESQWRADLLRVLVYQNVMLIFGNEVNAVTVQSDTADYVGARCPQDFDIPWSVSYEYWIRCFTSDEVTSEIVQYYNIGKVGTKST